MCKCPARLLTTVRVPGIGRGRVRKAVQTEVMRPQSGTRGVSPARFSPELMYAAARLYYLEDATQAAVAETLGTSRATVSRLLAEARRYGIVRIDVSLPTDTAAADLATRTAERLGLAEVHLSAGPATGHVGAALAPALSAALEQVALRSGDILLVASGRSVYEAAQFDLPHLPGVLVVPTVGGQAETEAWYQTNEIAREVAAKVGGRPVFLYAPALPGPDLYTGLQQEPSILRVLSLWREAACAVVGIGAPPLTRTSIADSVPTDAPSLKHAVGDICLRFFDRVGEPVDYPGSRRLMALDLDDLRAIPASIAVAIGPEKVAGILAGAVAGYFNRLVTDPPTATLLLAAASDDNL
jgi:DNA-binding transcriptional regulator LsrR (DeoR family)